MIPQILETSCNLVYFEYEDTCFDRPIDRIDSCNVARPRVIQKNQRPSYSHLMTIGLDKFKRTMISSQLMRLKYEFENDVDIDSITISQLAKMSLSEVVRIAYACLLRAERDEEVQLNMSTWHDVRQYRTAYKYHFCFAGALAHYVFNLRQRRRLQFLDYPVAEVGFKSLVREVLHDEKLSQHEEHFQAVFHALNALRAGDCEVAESIVFAENTNISSMGQCVYSLDKDAFHEMILKYVLPDLEMREKRHKKEVEQQLSALEEKMHEFSVETQRQLANVRMSLESN